MGRKGDKERDDQIIKLIAQTPCRDLRPLKTLNDRGFRYLISFIEPNVVITSLTRITDIINALYLSAKRMYTFSYYKLLKCGTDDRFGDKMS